MNDYRVIERIFDTIYRNTEQANAFSFSAWRERCQQTRAILMDTKARHQQIIDGLSKVYTKEILAQNKKNLDDEMDAMIATARDLIEKDFDLVMSAKREQYDRAHDAPTEEQARLLSVLSMRSKIDPAEVATIARKVSDNLQALRVLKDICERHSIIFPRLKSEDEFERAMETMTEQCKIACQDCALDSDKLGYMGRLFWETPDQGLSADAAQMLDNPVFLTVDDSIFRKVMDAPAPEEAPQQAETDRPVTEASGEILYTLKYDSENQRFVQQKYKPVSEDDAEDNTEK